MSNFGLIMGVAGARVSAGTVLVAGVAGLVSGAMSMGAGEYVSVRTQRELLEAGRAVSEEDNVKPLRAAGANGLLFAVGGFVPLLPFLLLSGTRAVALSVALSIGALFSAGVMLTRLTARQPVQVRRPHAGDRRWRGPARLPRGERRRGSSRCLTRQWPLCGVTGGPGGYTLIT